MRKVTTLCVAIVLALTSFTSAVAQTVDWGIVAGFNLTKVKINGSARDFFGGNFASDNKAGWYVGPKVNVNTVIGLGVDAALQYSERDLDINGESETYRTIEVPINLRYNIGLGKKAGIYLSTGPQFGFALQNMRWHWEDFASGNNLDRSFGRRNMNMTWNIGAGLRLLNHLEVGIGYNFALSRTGKAILENLGVPGGSANDYELRYRTNSFQVQVAYLF